MKTAKSKKVSARTGRSLRDYLLQVRLTEEEKQIFSKAADGEHVVLSTWVRLACFKAVREGGL